MLKEMTRSTVIQIWFTAAALIVVAAITLGVSMSIGTAVMLLALCLVPPAIVLKLWPGGAEAPTAAEVLHDVKGRV